MLTAVQKKTCDFTRLQVKSSHNNTLLIGKQKGMVWI